MKEKISIIKNGGEVFYHVEGDITRYFDLISISRNHPELQEYIGQHKFDLQGRFFREQDRHNMREGS